MSVHVQNESSQPGDPAGVLVYRCLRKLGSKATPEEIAAEAKLPVEQVIRVLTERLHAAWQPKPPHHRHSAHQTSLTA